MSIGERLLTPSLPATASAASAKVSMGIASPPESPGSLATLDGSNTRCPSERSGRASGSAPGTLRTLPSSASSPIAANRADPRWRIWPLASRMPMAIAKSKEPPLLRKSAGARLIVMRRAGQVKPEARIAERIRSRASPTAVSGSPTMRVAGIPGAPSTSTSTGTPSMPTSAVEATEVGMARGSQRQRTAGVVRVRGLWLPSQWCQ